MALADELVVVWSGVFALGEGVSLESACASEVGGV